VVLWYIFFAFWHVVPRKIWQQGPGIGVAKLIYYFHTPLFPHYLKAPFTQLGSILGTQFSAFSTIFGEKIGVFLKNQYCDQCLA
jgi:hypothetical protein